MPIDLFFDQEMALKSFSMAYRQYWNYYLYLVQKVLITKNTLSSTKIVIPVPSRMKCRSYWNVSSYHINLNLRCAGYWCRSLTLVFPVQALNTKLINKKIKRFQNFINPQMIKYKFPLYKEPFLFLSHATYNKLDEKKSIFFPKDYYFLLVHLVIQEIKIWLVLCLSLC